MSMHYYTQLYELYVVLGVELGLSHALYQQATPPAHSCFDIVSLSHLKVLQWDHNTPYTHLFVF